MPQKVNCEDSVHDRAGLHSGSVNPDFCRPHRVSRPNHSRGGLRREIRGKSGIVPPISASLRPAARARIFFCSSVPGIRHQASSGKQRNSVSPICRRNRVCQCPKIHFLGLCDASIAFRAFPVEVRASSLCADWPASRDRAASSGRRA